MWYVNIQVMRSVFVSLFTRIGKQQLLSPQFQFRYINLVFTCDNLTYNLNTNMTKRKRNEFKI